MNITISLHEAAKILGRKDVRTAEKWCGRNGVRIFFDKINKRKEVVKSEFINKRYRDVISYLKEKYGVHWKEAYRMHLDSNLIDLAQLEFEEKIHDYNPIGENENRFMSILSKL